MAEFVFSGVEIPFCPGPCISTKCEGAPCKINDEFLYLFKPNNGGRYPWYIWPLSDGGTVIVKNIRVCPGCKARYQEMASRSDGDTVLKKLMGYMPEIAPSGPSDDE